MYFYVSHGRICHLRFGTDLDCTSSGVASNPNFNAGPAFTRRPNASFSVTSHSDVESCDGFADIRIQRAAVTPPRPSWP